MTPEQFAAALGATCVLLLAAKVADLIVAWRAK